MTLFQCVFACVLAIAAAKPSVLGPLEVASPLSYAAGVPTFSSYSTLPALSTVSHVPASVSYSYASPVLSSVVSPVHSTSVVRSVVAAPTLHSVPLSYSAPWAVRSVLPASGWSSW